MASQSAYKHPGRKPASQEASQPGSQTDRDSMSLNEYAAGAFGGVSGIIVGHPFDTAKLQLQVRTSGDQKIGKLKDAFYSVNAQGMKRGLFRGMAFPVSTYAVVNSAYFGVYGNSLKWLEPDKSKEPTHMQVYLAGCVGGFAQLLLACPVEVCKCTMQSQIPLTRRTSPTSHAARPRTYYTGPIECCVDILKKQGPKGLYKGFWTMFVRDVPSFGLYIFVYERLNRYMIDHKLTDTNGVVAAMTAGGVAGCVCWASIMPFDVVKSKLQTDHEGRYRGFFDCATQSVRTSGFSVLFRGMVITMLRAFPVNAVTFLLYSKSLAWLDEVNPPAFKRDTTSS